MVSPEQIRSVRFWSQLKFFSVASGKLEAKSNVSKRSNVASDHHCTLYSQCTNKQFDAVLCCEEATRLWIMSKKCTKKISGRNSIQKCLPYAANTATISAKTGAARYHPFVYVSRNVHCFNPWTLYWASHCCSLPLTSQHGDVSSCLM